MSLIRALHAETLKLKRTLAFRMIFVAPLLVAALQFFVILNQRRPAADFNLWGMISRASLSVWAVFMLPLLITLETALINGVEQGETWSKRSFCEFAPCHVINLSLAHLL